MINWCLENRCALSWTIKHMSSLITKRFRMTSIALFGMAKVLKLMEISIFTEKFGKKAMVWQAICDCDVCYAFWAFHDNGHNEHRGACCPWPEGITTPFCFGRIWYQYTTQRMQWPGTNPSNSSFVPMEMNSPNCLQTRPIEPFGPMPKGIWENMWSQQNPSKTSLKTGKTWPKTIANQSVLKLMIENSITGLRLTEIKFGVQPLE